jgi:hypothetical protein
MTSRYENEPDPGRIDLEEVREVAWWFDAALLFVGGLGIAMIFLFLGGVL